MCQISFDKVHVYYFCLAKNDTICEKCHNGVSIGKTWAQLDNQVSVVGKAQYYVWKSCILLARTDIRKINSVA